MHTKKLVLFANSKARDSYIRERYGFATVDITGYRTFSEFFRKSIDKFMRDYNLEKDIMLITKYMAIVYMKNSLEEYGKNNKYSIISKEESTYDLASNIYSLYGEITFATLLSNDNNIFENENILKEVKEIISIYKQKLSSLNLTDEYYLYYNFIKSIEEKKTSLEYDYIEVHNFETITSRYSIFLRAFSDAYGVEVKIILPYSKEYFTKYGDIKNMYFDLDNFEESSPLSNFAKSLITRENTDKYRRRIHFLAGFGIKQEIDNVIDSIISLKEKGESLHDIAIIFDDMENYHDKIVERLNECKIDFDERRGYPLWKSPIIQVITSVFFVIEYKSPGYERGEINVNALIKILSSPYVRIEGIDFSNIRNIFYDKFIFHLYEKMPKDIFISRFTNVNIKEEYIWTAKQTLKLLTLIENLAESKDFPTITSRYLELLEFFNVASTIEENSKTYLRDNHSLACFIELVLSMSLNEGKTNIREYNAILNMMIREKYLEPEHRKEKSLTLATLYDIRGVSFKHIFILAMNNDFLTRKPNTFLIGNSLRENINKKYKKNILNTQEIYNFASFALFINIISKSYSDVYFSFRYKDESGNIELPFSYLEEIFLSITGKSFDFQNLKDEGLIYREDYIVKDDLIRTEKENMMSLFYYKKARYKLPKNVNDIIESAYKNRIKNDDYILGQKDTAFDICKYYLSKSLSVSDVESMMSCPGSFIDSKFFKEDAFASSSIGIKKIDKGIIYHDVFRLFFIFVNHKMGSSRLVKGKISEYRKIAREVISDVKNNTKYKIFDEKDIDIKVLQEELENVMKSFILSEIELSEKSEYTPAMFEVDFSDYTIYKNENISLKIKGRIDRIDLHYNNKNIVDGIRIVDYKSKPNDRFSNISSLSKENILSKYLQPILYLDYCLKNLVKDTVEMCEVAFSGYDEALINENKHFVSFADKDTLLGLCSDNKTDDEVSLREYLSKVCENMGNGIIDYFPDKENCKICTKRFRCKYAIIED